MESDGFSTVQPFAPSVSLNIRLMTPVTLCSQYTRSCNGLALTLQIKSTLSPKLISIVGIGALTSGKSTIKLKHWQTIVYQFPFLNYFIFSLTETYSEVMSFSQQTN